MNRKKHTLIYEKVNLTQNLNTTPLDVTGLDGDSWDYMVELEQHEAQVSNNNRIRLVFNDDTGGSAYRRYGMVGSASIAYAYVDDTNASIWIAQTEDTSTPSIARAKITGSSGSERYIDVLEAGDDSGTSRVMKKSHYWTNTADNLTKMTLDRSISESVAFTIRIYQIPKKANLDNYDLVEKVDFSARNLLSSPIVFDNLNGDSDGEYLVEWLGLSQFPQLQLNSITGYTVQELRNNNGTIQAQNYSETESWTYGGLEGCSTIDAVSGRKRLIKSTLSNRVFASQQFEVATWCNNTADEITSITFSTDVATTTDGSVKLYKRKSNKTIDPVPMETLVEYDIAGVDFSAGITITGLQGDRINGAIKIEYIGDIGATAGDYLMTLNNDTGSNYSYQLLTGVNSSASASSGTSTSVLCADGNIGVENFTMWIYPNSGQNRPILREYNGRNNARVEKSAHWYDNSVDEISRIDIFRNTSDIVTGTIRISAPKGTKMASPSAIVTVN